MYPSPNFYQYPNFTPKTSLFSKIKTIKFSEILNGTQKTLNIINQAIPIFNQIKPLINNTRTILKIANAINTNDKKQNIKKNEIKKIETKHENIKKNIDYNKPTFFI